MLTSTQLNASWLVGWNITAPEATRTIQEGDTLTYAGVTFTVLHTPGHTPGSVCYQTGDWLFTGDTLFRDSIGRTDFPGSNPIDMRNSLCALKMINGDYKVLPGHGPASSLRYEQNNNPYMRNLK